MHHPRDVRAVQRLQRRLPGRVPVHRLRTGLSLVEVLVTISIITVLIGILLPAVQAARESSRRTACMNHLRQLGLAMEQFVSAREHYPPGRLFGTFGWGPNSTAWSWLAELLPYVERADLHEAGDIPQATLAGSGATNKQVAVFFCASDDAQAIGTRTDAGNLSGLEVGLANYKAVSGSNWGYDTSLGAWQVTYWPHEGVNGSFDGLDEGDGMLLRSDYDQPRRKAQIKDGTSNTLLLGEDVPALNRWVSWPYANNAYGTCAIPPNTRAPGGGALDPFDFQNTWGFRSSHPGTLQFALADGSVRTLSDEIDLDLYRALATIAGGETIALPE